MSSLGSTSSPPTPRAHLDFASTRLQRLRIKPFAVSRYIDWNTLREFGIETQVRELISVGAWERFFSIQEYTYQDLTLEFMYTFELDRSQRHLGLEDTINFRVFGRQYSLSLTTFSLALGLYDPDFIATDDYSQLLTSLPVGLTEGEYWERISRKLPYDPRSSKASTLHQPAHRFIHGLLARTLSGRGSSFGVVGRQDVFYLYSMIENVPVHLGAALVHFMRHQCEDTRVGHICVGPYVTKLVRGMGLLDREPVDTLLENMIPFGPEMLRGMRLFQPARPAHRDQTKYVDDNIEGVKPLENLAPELEKPSPDIEGYSRQVMIAPDEYGDQLDTWEHLRSMIDQMEYMDFLPTMLQSSWPARPSEAGSD